jgi:hypothetical protein
LTSSLDDDARGKETHRVCVGFLEALTRCAASLVASKYASACLAWETEIAENAKKGAKAPQRSKPGFFGSGFSESHTGSVGDTARAFESLDASRHRIDVPWLHLADECASFDAEMRRLIETYHPRGADWSAAYVHKAAFSCLARLASIDRRTSERWFRAELEDAKRDVDACARAPNDRGWVPEAIGATGLEDGESDWASGTASVSGFQSPRLESAPASLPAADAACDAIRRATARALAIPGDARIPRDEIEDLAGRRFSGTQTVRDAGVSPRARDAFDAAVAIALADHFLEACARKADAHDAFGALAENGRDAVRGMIRIGRCAASATRVSKTLRAIAESPASVLGFGPERFASVLGRFEKYADAWTETLVDASFGAFVHAMAGYEAGGHVLTFSHGAEDDRDGAFEPGSDFDCKVGPEPEPEPEDAPRTVSMPVPVSGALRDPLDVLRERLFGLRAALSCAERESVDAVARGVAASRRFGRLISRRFLTETASRSGAAFSRAGGNRFLSDVESVVECFSGYVRRPEASCFREAKEAAILLTLDRVSADRLRAACRSSVQKARARDSAFGDLSVSEPERVEAAAAREASEAVRASLGIYALDDAAALEVLSRRIDMGASVPGRRR